MNCTPSQFSCYNDELWQCDAAGNNWQLIEPCLYGCGNETACAGAPEIEWERGVWMAAVIMAIAIGVFIGKNYKKIAKRFIRD